ncbi:MAG: maleylpyruvate isomerase family mycothiol-dependent enzyme [Acidimicrobiia bacterium]
MYKPLSDADVLAWIADDAAALADAAEDRGPVAVPSCPGWDVSELLAHVGGFFAGWYLYNLTHDPASGDLMAAASSAPPMPELHADRVRYFREGATAFAAAADDADLDATVWAFGSTAPARYWIHRAASEVAVHRWDVEDGLGRSYRLPTSRATMSFHETVCGLWPEIPWLMAQFQPDVAMELPTESLGLTATDGDASWLARPERGGIEVRPVAEPTGDVQVVGTAHDLVMWLWGRGVDGDVAIEGNRELARAWNMTDRAGL